MALRNVIGWIDFSELSIIIRRCGKKGRGLVSLERSRAPRCAWLLAFRGFPILAQERARPYWRQFAHAQSWPETDSFSHTDSWRRPSGGLLTPSQPRRRRDAPPPLSSAHLCPPTFPLLLCIEGGPKDWAGQHQHDERAQIIITYIETTRRHCMYTLRRKKLFSWTMTISCFNRRAVLKIFYFFLFLFTLYSVEWAKGKSTYPV